MRCETETTGNSEVKGQCCCPAPEPVSEQASCCGPPALIRGGKIDDKVPGFLAWLPSQEGAIPRVSTQLTLADRLGTCRVRMGFGRMNYLVPPGLYAIGIPSPDDPVMVTANYKMSYDAVRSSLTGRNAWLLVLETFGVNVWCAAGKGSFGTAELVQRIEQTGLSRMVAHRRLILPILGAPGIAAHEVRDRTGFAVCYGTIRAEELPEFLDNGMVTTPRMRKLTFTMRERVVLIPVEVVLAWKSLAVAAALLFAMTTLRSGPEAGLYVFAAFLGAALTGLVAVPLLLPWLPGRSFSFKGALAGICWVAIFFLLFDARSTGIWTVVSAALALPAVSAYYALAFTGCSTFTSRSGVRKEMRVALPLMAAAVLLGGAAALAGWVL